MLRATQKKLKKKKSKETKESSHCGSAEVNPTRIHEDVGLIPGLAQWVRDPVLLWLWCRLNSTPSLGTCIGCGAALKTKTKTNPKNKTL